MFQSSWFNKILVFVILAGSWQLTAMVFNNSMLWPDIVSVVIKLWELMGRTNFTQAIWNSLFMATASWLATMLIALVVTLITFRYTAIKKIIQDIADIIGPTPTMSWFPIFLIFYGFSKSTLYMLLIWAVVWLAIPGFYSLIEMSQQTWQKQIQNLRFDIWQALKHVYVPSLLPGYIISAKTYFFYIWRTLFGCEIVFGSIGGHVGIGGLMYEYKGKFDHVDVYACLLLIMLLGALMSLGFKQLQKKIND